MIKVAVSACLLGAPVRADGTHRRADHPVLRRWIEEGRVLSICPEMLAGLGTPRPPAEIVDGRVVTNAGDDVTRAFEEGARIAMAEAGGIRIAVLKDGSPSCGSSFIYDGSFTHTRVPGNGVTAALLREHGIRVFSEEELDAADAWVRALDPSA